MLPPTEFLCFLSIASTCSEASGQLSHVLLNLLRYMTHSCEHALHSTLEAWKNPSKDGPTHPLELIAERGTEAARSASPSPARAPLVPLASLLLSDAGLELQGIGGMQAHPPAAGDALVGFALHPARRFRQWMAMVVAMVVLMTSNAGPTQQSQYHLLGSDAATMEACVCHDHNLCHTCFCPRGGGPFCTGDTGARSPACGAGTSDRNTGCWEESAHQAQTRSRLWLEIPLQASQSLVLMLSRPELVESGARPLQGHLGICRRSSGVCEKHKHLELEPTPCIQIATTMSLTRRGYVG
jgi:hypothetical protein